MEKNLRIGALKFCFIILFIFLIACLYYLQLIKGALYTNLSIKNSIRLLDIAATRGIIYDRNNEILAANELSFRVFVIAQELADFESEITFLSEILEVPESLLRRNYKRNYYAPFAPCEVLNNVSTEKAVLIEELKLDMPGVLVEEMPIRSYPYGEASAHVIGYIGEADKREMDILKSYGYASRGLIGKDGVERSFDAHLRGHSGGMQVLVDNRGRQVRVLSSLSPVRGEDVYLTIDAGLQEFIWRMMQDKKGAVIFMDPNTGELLSMVSSPSYDPNESIASMLNDVDAPLLNRCIKGLYPPGSIFKLAIAVAGLDTGRIYPDKTFLCPGVFKLGEEDFHCWNRDGHGIMSLKTAIIQSCNIYFFNLGMTLTVDRIYEYAGYFGFGRKTGIDILGELDGSLPSRAWKKTDQHADWYAGDTANLSIGQGYLLVTPLQIVRMIGCIANGGKLVTPHLLKKIGQGEEPFYKHTNLRFKKTNLDFVREAMKGVVEDDYGTGVFARSGVVSISGKTGTSQVGATLKTHAWFGGFAPSENPKICFVVFLEHGGSGGDMPALIAKKAVEYWYEKKI